MKRCKWCNRKHNNEGKLCTWCRNRADKGGKRPKRDALDYRLPGSFEMGKRR